jgi:site-specific DNA-cytosine methylase
MRAMDCQSFAGAFALGVTQVGFEYVGKREQVGGFGVPLVEGNRHLIKGDWQSEACEPDAWTAKPADLVFGNPPCSGFSGLSVCIAPGGGHAGRRKQHASGRVDWRGIDSSANSCMWALIEFAARCKPQIVIFESVQQAGKVGRPLMQALRDRLEEKTRRRWHLTHVFQNDLSLGGCSMRKRYFFVASRMPFGVELPVLDRVRTLRDAIGDLEDVPLGNVNGHTPLNSQRARRMAWLASNVEWNGGEQSGVALDRAREAKLTLPDDWFTTKGTLVRTDAGTSLYAPRRWKYDDPARVLTGLGLEENVHPTLPRTFTHREAARIMGFPDEWNCQPAVDRGHTGAKWWGKQIPVGAGRWIAWWAANALGEEPGDMQGEEVGKRERVIDVTNAHKAVA